MIKLALAIAFLSVFGLVGYAIVMSILKNDNKAEEKKSQPKHKK